MEDRIPLSAAVAAVVHVATLAGLGYALRRLLRQERCISSWVDDVHHLRSEVDDLRLRLDVRAAVQSVSRSKNSPTGQPARRHLASVTALPCPKGVQDLHPLGGAR